jgi:CubicO group peptidase (beta-lactamase class C family)
MSATKIAAAAIVVLAAGMGLKAQRGNPRLSYGGQSIDDMIVEFMADQDVDGMALAIVQAPYIPRVAGYGIADRERKLLASSNTLFDLGRMAEAYTAVAVMQLVERGKVALDDPAGRHVGGLPSAWQGITVRALLAHASGIADYTRLPSFDPSRRYRPEELTALAAAESVAFLPGQSVASSATDYLLLARIVEAAAGQPFQEFVRQNQFDRLRLRQTFFSDEVDRIRSEAVEANGNRHKDFLLDPVLINPTERAAGAVGRARLAAAGGAARMGSGSILASAMDVSIWDIGLAGEILVQDASLRAMLCQPATAGGQTVPVMGAWRFPGRKGLMYVSGNANGQSAFLSRFTDPSELVCVTLLANKEGLDLTQLARRIAGAFDPRLGPPLSPEGMRFQQSPYSVRETRERVNGIAPDLRSRFSVMEEGGQVWLGYADPAGEVRLGGGAALRERLDRVALGIVTPY